MFYIEFAPSFRKRPIRHLLMDWDGTTSMGRAGWADIMTDVYVRHLPHIINEDAEQRRKFAWDELMPLNGKPAIHQMEHLTKLVSARGGEPLTAAQYQDEFQAGLSAMVRTRMDNVRNNVHSPDVLLVPGVRELLTELRNRGIGLTLATGTPINQVLEEARLLGIENYFDAIHGPEDLADRKFSKRGIIAEILKNHSIEGESLLALGDGPAEIIETKAVGGLAVAVASDEIDHGSGKIDEWKRRMLLSLGADVVIADFSHPRELLAAILP